MWNVKSDDGTALQVYELGGSGPVLLIVHATGLCAQMYGRFADHLTGRFRVVAFDVRAHGDSAKPHDGSVGLAWERVAEDVRAVRAELGDEVHGFGHSMGGAALLLAEAAHPGLFASLYLYEPIVFGPGVPDDGQNFMAANARRRRSSFASRDEVLRRFAGRAPFADIRSGFLYDYVEHGFADIDGGVLLKCLPEHEATFFEGGREVRLAMVASVRCPTVVAVGASEEGPNPSVLGAPLAVAIGGRLIRYESCGHFGPFQDPHNVAVDLVAHALTVPTTA